LLVLYGNLEPFVMKKNKDKPGKPEKPGKEKPRAGKEPVNPPKQK
jgi:hypothetical protein